MCIGGLPFGKPSRFVSKWRSKSFRVLGTDSEHCCAANLALAFLCGFTILHCYSFYILTFAGCSTFNTVHCHLYFTSFLVNNTWYYLNQAKYITVSRLNMIIASTIVLTRSLNIGLVSCKRSDLSTLFVENFLS